MVENEIDNCTNKEDKELSFDRWWNQQTRWAFDITKLKL